MIDGRDTLWMENTVSRKALINGNDDLDNEVCFRNIKSGRSPEGKKGTSAIPSVLFGGEL